MDKSKLFRDAWKKAREAASLHGGTSKEYFAACLRGQWAQAKEEKENQAQAKENQMLRHKCRILEMRLAAKEQEAKELRARVAELEALEMLPALESGVSFDYAMM